MKRGILSLLLVAFAATATEAAFNLGAAGTFGVLVEPSAHNFQLNNSTVTGNVGVGAGVDAIQIASNGFITGQLLLADTGLTVANSGNVSGGVLQGQSQVTTALNDINTLSSTLGIQVGTGLSITSATTTINVNTGTLIGGNYVFTIASNGFNNDNTGFTVSGGAGDFVVFNINNGTSNEDFGGPISLSGGITSDHVLFNYVGTGGELKSALGGATVNGIFLAPHMKINIDNVTINGRLFGGLTDQDFQLVSGFNLNAPADIPGVPEPSALCIYALGATLIGLTRLRPRWMAIAS
jgi:choice-of-anchor A domain-containing protein